MAIALIKNGLRPDFWNRHIFPKVNSLKSKVNWLQQYIYSQFTFLCKTAIVLTKSTQQHGHSAELWNKSCNRLATNLVLSSCPSVLRNLVLSSFEFWEILSCHLSNFEKSCHVVLRHQWCYMIHLDLTYGVASVSRIDKIIGFFCKRAL